ncbi:UNVERIFIED_CONTAM: hypothetical protein NCL1_50409 [Trichonephila clavipes]
MNYVNKQNKGQTKVERLFFLLGVRHDIPRGKKSGIDKSWEHGGQRPLEMTRSSKNSTDSLFIGLLRKAVSTSATFVFTMEALPDFFLSATDTVSRNYCTIVDAFGAVSPGYFY